MSLYSSIIIILHALNLSTLFAGLSIEFMGVIYANNTAINITDVGIADSEAVLCTTNLTTCCDFTKEHTGNWIYPNGTYAGNRPSRHDIFRSRGDMVVRLHKMENVTSPAGQYCCEVPTMDNPSSDSRICITLSKICPGLYERKPPTSYFHSL